MNVPIIRRGNFYNTSDDLNFYIVAQTEQPLDPKENTVWINTDVEMTTWRFSTTSPSEPIEGMVWISISASSPVGFNAVTTNEIFVCPNKAKQYISGSWVEKKMNIYVNGTWSSPILYLYKDGDLCSNITGGWGTSGYSFGVGTWYNASFNSTNMYLCGKNNQYGHMVGTINAVDLTNYDHIYFDVACTGYSEKSYLGVGSKYIADWYDNNAIAKYTIGGTMSRKTVSVPIGSISGGKYIHILSVGTTPIYVYNIYLQ